MRKLLKIILRSLWASIRTIRKGALGCVTENVQDYDDFSDDIKAYLAKKTLELATKKLRFYQVGDKFPLGKGEGRTFKIVKYARINLPQSSLTEGVTPNGSSMTISSVTAIAEQWGAYVTLSDVSILTITHPVLTKANELLGKQAAETVDREVQQVLEGATNIQYADKDNVQTNDSRDDLAAEDVLCTAELQLALANLRNNGAPEYDDMYLGILDPSVEMDVTNDTKWVAAAEYSNIKALYAGEVGQWFSIRWLRSNFVQKYVGIAAVSVTTDSTASTLTAADHDIVVVGRNKVTGFDERISTIVAQTPTVSESIAVTMPSDTDYTYDVYCGLTSGHLAKLTTLTDQVASDSVIVSAIGTGAAAPIAPTATVTVHNVWVFGKGAFGVTELSKIVRTLTPSVASDSDPLEQRRKTGWKAFFKAVILNNAFMRKIECGSAF